MHDLSTSTIERDCVYKTQRSSIVRMTPLAKVLPKHSHAFRSHEKRFEQSDTTSIVLRPWQIAIILFPDEIEMRTCKSDFDYKPSSTHRNSHRRTAHQHFPAIVTSLSEPFGPSRSQPLASTPKQPFSHLSCPANLIRAPSLKKGRPQIALQHKRNIEPNLQSNSPPPRIQLATHHAGTCRRLWM